MKKTLIILTVLFTISILEGLFDSSHCYGNTLEGEETFKAWVKEQVEMLLPSIEETEIGSFSESDSGTGLDTDDDAIDDNFLGEEDNCPLTPNGPGLGTCSSGTIGALCTSHDECGDNGFCSMNQEDTDNDGKGDVCDNCPTTPNPDQEDTFPPQGNGIGDACECEADFDGDQDVDADDLTTLLEDFGREEYYQPCTNEEPCSGDFDCDADVDANDVDKLLEDFGREEFYNPCPACVMEDWCSY